MKIKDFRSALHIIILITIFIIQKEWSYFRTLPLGKDAQLLPLYNTDLIFDVLGGNRWEA